MTGSTTPGWEQAGVELRRQAVGLAQGWQAFRSSGWSMPQARPVLVAARNLLKLTERMRLGSLKQRASEIETALRSCAESGSSFTDLQVRHLDAALSALASSVLALDLAALKVEFQRSAANEPSPPMAVSIAGANRRHEVRKLVVVRADPTLVHGLEAAAAEQGLELEELGTPQALADYLATELPLAAVIDARFLSALGRILPWLKARPGSGERDARIVVVSARRDMGRKLLAMRNGAHAYFEEPIDLLRLLRALGLDESPVAGNKSPRPVLLISADRPAALEYARWLVPLNATVRVETDLEAARNAMAEQRPLLVGIDESLGVDEALAQAQSLRMDPERGDLALVLIASANSLALRERAIAAGFDEYLLKPVKPRHLLSVVHSRLERAERARRGKLARAISADGLLRRDAFILQAARPSGQLKRAVCFVSIDQADRLHSSLGLLGMGELDRHLVSALRSAMSPTDCLAHFQDGMYLVLIERPDRDALFSAADRLRMAIAHADSLPNRGRLRLSASVGLCESLEGEQQAEIAVHNARAATLAGQELGGNRCLWFETARAAIAAQDPQQRGAPAPAPGTAAPGRSAVEPTASLLPLLPINGRLHGQYWLKFQWPPVQAGLQPQNYADYAAGLEPDQRIELDRGLIERALDFRAQELKRGKQVRLFVELTSALLIHGGLPGWLGEKLGDKRLSGTGLTLAFPGSVGIDHQDAFIATAPALSQLGVRLALMHLGRDMALIHHLRTLPCDFVVLMPEVVEGLSSEGRQPVIETLLRKAREAGSATIVPGVERPEWLPRLKALRVDYVLSQRFGPAMPRADFDFDVPVVS